MAHFGIQSKGMENSGYLTLLTHLLQTDERLSIEGELNKNKVAELARHYDSGLLNLLQSDSDIKRFFFVETDSGLVFKKDIFLQFLANKQFLPDSYTAYKNKIGLATGVDNLLGEGQDVVLNWPYKDTVLEGGQDKEDAKRDEVFFNESLAPDQINRLLDDKVFVDWKRYDVSGAKQLDQFQQDDNLILKGNNLVVLHSLKKRYGGKVKLIYIDPPYNTESDSFRYNDKFTHSTWLTFMKNRLEVARELLREDGLLFVQCDDNEQAYLKVLLDEIFSKSQDNFVNTVAVRMSTASGMKTAHREKTIIKTKEYLLVYARDKKQARFTPIYVRKDHYDDEYGFYLERNGSDNPADWSVTKLDDKLSELGIATVKDLQDPAFKKFYLENAENIWARGRHHSIPKDVYQLSQENRDTVYGYGAEGGVNYAYRGRRLAFLSKTIKECFDEEGNIVSDIATLSGDLWNEVSTAKLFSEGGVELPNGKKPEYLLQKVILTSTRPGELVLDYHLGSGTTAAVAHKMGRQYIGIEQLYYGDNDPTVRLGHVIAGDQTGISKSVGWKGGGSFVYAVLKNDANEFRERVQHATHDRELIGLLEEAGKSSFLSYRVDPANLNPGDKDFASLSLAHKKQLLLELVDNNTLYVNYSDIDDRTYAISDRDKQFNKALYKPA